MKEDKRNVDSNYGLFTVARFNEVITFEEFDNFIRSHHKKPNERIFTDVCKITAKSKYRANVTTHNGKELLYLFIPRSENGKKFWSISRRILKEENEAGIMDIILHGRDDCRSIGNTPRIVFGRKNK